jgi:hypothetical protein
LEKTPDSVAPKITPAVLAEAEEAAAMSLLAAAKAQSADVDTLVSQLFKLSDPTMDQQNTDFLLKKATKPRDRLEILVSILALEKIPARIANGIELRSPQSGAKPQAWLEVFDKGGWYLYHGISGENLPLDEFLILWRGSGPMVELEGGTRLETDLALTSIEGGGGQSG